MLHQPIEIDPEVVAAVADFRDTVVAIREHSLRLFYLPEGSVERAAEQERVDDLVASMQARCDRIDATLDDLFRLVNLDLLHRGGAASRPTGEFLHTLTRAATDARNAEAAAHQALSAAQEQVRSATDERLAAERACAGYAADWMIR